MDSYSPAFVDIVVTSVSIEPGEENNILLAGQDTVFTFQYQLIASDTATPPTEIPYRAVISLDNDMDNPTNHEIVDAGGTLTVADGQTVSCKFTGILIGVLQLKDIAISCTKNRGYKTQVFSIDTNYLEIYKTVTDPVERRMAGMCCVVLVVILTSLS